MLCLAERGSKKPHPFTKVERIIESEDIPRFLQQNPISSHSLFFHPRKFSTIEDPTKTLQKKFLKKKIKKNISFPCKEFFFLFLLRKCLELSRVNKNWQAGWWFSPVTNRPVAIVLPEPLNTPQILCAR
jgi:hypothetical protein